VTGYTSPGLFLCLVSVTRLRMDCSAVIGMVRATFSGRDDVVGLFRSGLTTDVTDSTVTVQNESDLPRLELRLEPRLFPAPVGPTSFSHRFPTMICDHSASK